MSHRRSDLPLFYLLCEDEWPKSRRGSFFLAVMRDAARRRFADPRWQRIASTYRFERPLPIMFSTDPDDQAQVTDLLEWHHPGIQINRYEDDDRDEDAPLNVLVRSWTVYDLDDGDWQRAWEIETRCRARSDDQLREVDGLLEAFAQAALGAEVATFTLDQKTRVKLPIAPAFWDVELPVLRARHAHGRCDPDDAGSLSPHGRRAIFVEPNGLTTWLGRIEPIPFDAPPDRDRARAFLDDLEEQLTQAAHALQSRKKGKEGGIGLPGGKTAISAVLGGHPFNLSHVDSDALIGESLSQVFVKSGRPGGVKITGPILQNLRIKYNSPSEPDDLI